LFLGKSNNNIINDNRLIMENKEKIVGENEGKDS